MGECKHTNIKIWEPHLAGAQKCLDCGKVYNPNRGSEWFFEPPSAVEIANSRIATLEAHCAALRKMGEYYSRGVRSGQTARAALAATPETTAKAIEERTTVKVLEWVAEMCKIADIPRAPEYFKYEADRRRAAADAAQIKAGG